MDVILADVLSEREREERRMKREKKKMKTDVLMKTSREESE